MRTFFITREYNPSDTSVELISLHIPKSAGTSFRNTLKSQYGDKAVIRLDINLVKERIRINEKEITKPYLDDKVKVVHGHFSPALLEKYFGLPGDLPMITWLRHPVDRIISNYYYLAKRLHEQLRLNEQGLRILKRMQRSLLEYAALESNQNRMSRFLQGASLYSFKFVGIQEFYDEDLEYLANLLNWTQYKHLKHNETGASKDFVSDEVRGQIEALNTIDMEIYEEALALRLNRMRE